MFLTFQFRLRPNPSVERELLRWLHELRFLHNYALEQRRTAWQKEHRSLSYLEQQSSLARWRDFDSEGLGSLPYDPARDVLQRVDLAFRAFFHRIGQGGSPGYPRFRREIRSFTFGQPDAVTVRTRTVRLPKLGAVPFVHHRPVPANGVLKKAIVTHEAGAWYIALAYALPDPPGAPPGPPENPVGVDLGLTHLATLSEGTTIDPPKYLRKAERRLARAQRSLARKRPGSHRRERQREKVARCHAKVRRQRRDFAHQLTSRWASRHDLIAFEDLDVTRLSRGPFARSFADAGWGMLRMMSRYKMAMRSGRYVEVRSEGTTQTCSICGHRADPPLTLKQREFVCPGGHRMDRDWNAARNILERGCLGVSRKPAELTRGEREPPPGSGDRRVYQTRRAHSGSRESNLTGGGAPPNGREELRTEPSRPER